ncbi:hypothetical protein QTP86_026698, partial [Hemibagrus guttatus]
QDNAPCHKAEMLQEWFDDHNNQFEVLTPPPNSPDLNPVQHLWDVLDKQVRSMESITSQLTGLKGSATNVLVADPTAHLQGSSGVHASTGQGCFSSKRDRHNIRQVVIIILKSANEDNEASNNEETLIS